MTRSNSSSFSSNGICFENALFLLFLGLSLLVSSTGLGSGSLLRCGSLQSSLPCCR